jgi:hypothetical protein
VTALIRAVLSSSDNAAANRDARSFVLSALNSRDFTSSSVDALLLEIQYIGQSQQQQQQQQQYRERNKHGLELAFFLAQYTNIPI